MTDRLLKNVDKITEVTFKISSSRRLFNDLFGKDYYKSDAGAYAYVVYLPDKKLLRGYQTKRKHKPQGTFKKELIDFIKLYRPSSFKDYLFFVDASPLFAGNPSISELPNRRFKRHELVDLMLAESKGFLLWEYQLKHLLALFWDKGYKKIRAMIERNPDRLYSKDPYYQLHLELFLHKRKRYWDLMKAMKFSRHVSMYDVLKERAIKGRIHNPNVERAYRLYKFLM